MRCRAVAGGLARSVVGTCAKLDETSSTASNSATNRGINGFSPCLTAVQQCAVQHQRIRGRSARGLLCQPRAAPPAHPAVARSRDGFDAGHPDPTVPSGYGAPAGSSVGRQSRRGRHGVLGRVLPRRRGGHDPLGTGALRFATAGIGGGCGLGVIGLGLTRWEPTPRSLHYTPNRWLVLAITLLVTARVLYGLWRTWSVAYVSVSDASFVTAFGVRETLAAGGIVLGYYLAYSAGLRWQIRRWQRRRLRMM